MNLKSTIAKPLAGYISKKIRKAMFSAVEDQEATLQLLIKEGRKTTFGKDHRMLEVDGYEQFKNAIPIRDYEQFRPYIDQIKEGKHHVLWKGLPVYFAKTSGTTSGVKYIPITKDSIDHHFNSSRNAVFSYVAETGNASIMGRKLLFLSGSPELERVGGIPTGRLSGIANHHIPRYYRSNQLPSFETNCIEDWEEKLDKIVEETFKQDMGLIGGIPPWMQMYFDRLIEKTGKKVGELFPNLGLLVQGGVNFEPYKSKLFDSLGKKIDYIELFPASEGFFAYQDSQNEPGLLLNTNAGIFFEFIPVNEIFNDQPTRLRLSEVQLGVNYALIVSTNAGLWSYNIGDTIKFVHLNPYRIIVTGRIKHFISAFGEHVITEEVEQALTDAAKRYQINITEFTVAPMIGKAGEASYHEWFIEFEDLPANLPDFAQKVDDNLRAKNIYYNDLVKGHILQPLVIRPVKKNTFIEYMKSVGKLGGQNKVPRLSNDRAIAEALQTFVIS